jgi:hypothetical protein
VVGWLKWTRDNPCLTWMVSTSSCSLARMDEPSNSGPWFWHLQDGHSTRSATVPIRRYLVAIIIAISASRFDVLLTGASHDENPGIASLQLSAPIGSRSGVFSGRCSRDLQGSACATEAREQLLATAANDYSTKGGLRRMWVRHPSRQESTCQRSLPIPLPGGHPAPHYHNYPSHSAAGRSVSGCTQAHGKMHGV